MDKSTFIKCIDAIKKQDEHDTNCANAIAKYFDAFEANLSYKNHWLQNALILVLQEEFEPNSGSHSWIEYFLWEIEFGAKDGKVAISGKSMPLKTPSDLYDLLIYLKENNL